MIDVINIPPLQKLCITIGQLPASYLASMGFEEQVLWLCNYLEKTVIPAIDNNAQALEEVQELFNILKNYVDNYFDNLDVQEEINNKLDEMLEDGSLESILENYVNIAKVYNTTSDMLQDSNLVNGQKIKTLGYYSLNDGGGADFVITNTQTNNLQFQTTGGLYAEMIIKDKIYTSQLGIKADNLTDNYSKLNSLFQFLNNYNNYLEIIFNGNDVIKFSDTLNGAFSNKKIILDTDLQFTKTENLSTENSLKGISISGTNESLLSNIIIEGNNHYIDGNGSNVTRNNSTTSGLYNAKTISFEYIENLKINNLIAKNGYKDCCGISSCQNAIIKNCQFLNSYRDNGLSISSSGINNPLPIIVYDCIAKNCRDLGFSTWFGKNIIFDNCKSINNGNAGATMYDDTYVSAGGGFSVEVPSASISEVDETNNVTFINCIAEKCNNYGFYCNVGNTKYTDCKVNEIYSTGDTGIRKGIGFILEEITFPIIIENCVIDSVNSIKSGIEATSLNTSNTSIYLFNNIINGILDSAYFIKNFKYNHLNGNIDNSTSNFGLQIQGFSSSNRSNLLKCENMNSNNHFKIQNINDVIINNLFMSYADNEENPYPVNISRGTNLFIDGTFIISESVPDYAIRVGGQYSGEDVTNIYEGTIKTNKTNTIDSAHHS